MDDNSDPAGSVFHPKFNIVHFAVTDTIDVIVKCGVTKCYTVSPTLLHFRTK